MANQSKLEEAAILARQQLIARNEYNGSDDSNGYSANHPNAKSDGDNKGRGTEAYLDTYNGGTERDEIERITLKAKNQYNADKGYQTPDTSANIGQVTF